MRAAYQELAAKGFMTLDELGERLAELEEERLIARNELEALKNRQERLEAMERDRDVLLQHYAGLVPEALDTLSPEERHRVYRMLRLKVTTQSANGGLEVTGVLCDSSSSLGSETEFLHLGITRYATAPPAHGPSVPLGRPRLNRRSAAVEADNANVFATFQCMCGILCHRERRKFL